MFKKDIKQTLNILEKYQRWRKGVETEMPSPFEITSALNGAIDFIKKKSES